MALIDEIAAKLSGRTRAEENIVSTDATTRTYVGTAVTDSADGSVYVSLSEDVTLPDDDDGEHGTGVEMPTTVGVSEGDEVLVTVFGGGTMKAPVVTGNPGWGDAVQEQVNNAESIAEQAEAVANATGQHFWPDTDGAHVTQVTKDDWNDSTSPNYHSGPNSLWNSLGMLFRDGLTNLLAILTNGIAIYDGQGNTADNILAEFASDHVRVGGNIPIGEGGGGASIEFFDQTTTHTSSMDASTYIDEYPAEGDLSASYDMRNETSITTSLDDDGRVVDTGSNGTAALELTQELSYGLTDVGEQTSEVTSAIVADATYDADGTNPVTSHAAVRAVALTGSGHSTGYSVVDIVAEQGIGIGTGDVGLQYISTPQVICALLQPYAMFVGSSGTATATASGWCLTYFNSVYSHSDNWSDYFSFSNGVITANRNIRLEISGCMNWTDSIAGNRGFGVFANSSTVASGTEYSEFTYFPNTVNTRKSVWMTGLVLNLNAGVSCAVGRYEQTNAVYVNGTNYSRIELKVLGVY